MPLPTNLGTLDFFKDGLPFVNIVAKATTVEFYQDGLPFYAPSAGTGPVTPPVPVYNAAQFFIMF